MSTHSSLLDYCWHGCFRDYTPIVKVPKHCGLENKTEDGYACVAEMDVEWSYQPVHTLTISLTREVTLKIEPNASAGSSSGKYHKPQTSRP